MSKLLARADMDLHIVELLLSPAGNPTNDEMATDMAAYHIQQAIEKALKYKTEMLGIPYKKTHDIRGLISVLENNGFKVSEELKNAATDISSWEAASRYSDDFSAVKSSIEHAVQLYKELRSQVLSSIQAEVPSLENRVNSILKSLNCSQHTYSDLKEYLPATELDDSSLRAAVATAVKILNK